MRKRKRRFPGIWVGTGFRAVAALPQGLGCWRSPPIGKTLLRSFAGFLNGLSDACWLTEAVALYDAVW